MKYLLHWQLEFGIVLHQCKELQVGLCVSEMELVKASLRNVWKLSSQPSNGYVHIFSLLKTGRFVRHFRFSQHNDLLSFHRPVKSFSQGITRVSHLSLPRSATIPGSSLRPTTSCAMETFYRVSAIPSLKHFTTILHTIRSEPIVFTGFGNLLHLCWLLRLELIFLQVLWSTMVHAIVTTMISSLSLKQASLYSFHTPCF